MAGTEALRIPVVARVDEDASIAPRLDRIWATRRGLLGALSSVDHKTIGKRYLVTAFVFLLVGGLEAAVMRAQLAQPNQTLLTPEQYNQLFTMHGVTMIFLYALPVLSGFSNFLWPLLLGSRDMAFPRLNAFSYWVFLFSGIFLYASFPLGRAPDAGWFNYVPYASLAFNPGINIDVYALGMILLGVSTTVGSINFVVTLIRTRAPGMSINRVPILVWGTLTASVGNLFAVPAVSLAFFMLWMDRRFGTHFFEVSGGGQPLLWQHLFWMFGHPWVYAIVLPAMGIVSDGLPTFCRRPLVGYTAVALATVTTMVLGFGVWVHHMFATGLPPMSLSFFSAASFIIVIPSAVAVFAWIATIWTGRPQFTTPFLFFAGFVIVFVIGGVSGFMTAAVPVDTQLTDTYFVVAHLHYVLIGINVLPVVGGIHYWFPKFTGRLMSERLGKWTFWMMFIGFNVGFFPMHIAGLLGMPRRIYTYPSGLGWGTVNLVITVGAYLFARRRAALRLQRVAKPARRRARRSQSMGRAVARMGDVVAAAAVQLRGHSDRREPLSALGRPPNRPRGQQLDARGPAARPRPRDDRHERARRRARRDPAHAGRLVRAAPAVDRTGVRLPRHADPLVVAVRHCDCRIGGRDDRVAVARSPPRADDGDRR